MNGDPYLLVRAGGLYLPIVIGLAACAMRRPTRAQLTGAFLAFAWNVPAILALHVVAESMGWWRFDAVGGLFLGMPVDLWLAWALLWGPVAFIAFPATPVAIVIGIGLALDLVLMPAAFPVVRLGDDWLIGEAAGLALCLAPSQWLARWTATDRRLPARALLQVIAFSGLIGWLLPAIAIDASGTSWRNPLDLPPPLLNVIAQLLALPAILGLAAVQEFVTRGGGTPIPYDPPRRIVTTGPYAYVGNPMQLAAVLVLAGIGAVLGNWWVAATGVMAHVYSSGIANWDEDQDLRARFGDDWPRYRAAVRKWWPRIRPWYRDEAPIATLYVSEECGMCSEVAHWYRRRGVRGLAIVAAEDHPRGGLTRITYESNDGAYCATGVNAIARALEHIHFGWAMTGFALRLPIVSSVVQRIIDASGGQPRRPVLRSPREGGPALHSVGEGGSHPPRVLELDQQLVGIQLPALEQRLHVVVVDHEQVRDGGKRPSQPRVDAD
jgi:protein-S-isoprenylcysteine O-methyltransferase Ste14